MPFFGSSLNVGALVEPLTSQMAEYLGVPNGLMVKQVARKSEAAVAGLKAFDVILKVGTEPVIESCRMGPRVALQRRPPRASDHSARQEAGDTHAAGGFKAPPGLARQEERVTRRRRCSGDPAADLKPRARSPDKNGLSS